MELSADNKVDFEPWPPTVMSSWEDFVQWVKETTEKTFLYRGQPRTYGTLEPQYLRLLRGGVAGRRQAVPRDQADKLEKNLLADFVREAPLHLDEIPIRRLVFETPHHNVLQWWGIMQHYGAPTRVLDWTGSPYVAAYFAVEKEFDRCGEVWGYDQEKLDDVWRPHFQNGPLKDYPRGLAGHSGNGLLIDGKPILQHFILGMQTGRMAAQQGVFTVCTDVYRDHGQLLQELLGPDSASIAYRRVIIPKRLKIEFLKQLRYMNITGVSLFPGIGGVGRKTSEAANIDLLRAE